MAPPALQTDAYYWDAANLQADAGTPNDPIVIDANAKMASCAVDSLGAIANACNNDETVAAGAGRRMTQVPCETLPSCQPSPA